MFAWKSISTWFNLLLAAVFSSSIYSDRFKLYEASMFTCVTKTMFIFSTFCVNLMHNFIHSLLFGGARTLDFDSFLVCIFYVCFTSTHLHTITKRLQFFTILPNNYTITMFNCHLLTAVLASCKRHRRHSFATKISRTCFFYRLCFTKFTMTTR